MREFDDAPNILDRGKWKTESTTKSNWECGGGVCGDGKRGHENIQWRNNKQYNQYNENIYIL